MSQEDRDEFDIASRSALGSELQYQVFMLGVACMKLVSRHCVSAVFERKSLDIALLIPARDTGQSWHQAATSFSIFGPSWVLCLECLLAQLESAGVLPGPVYVVAPGLRLSHS